MPYIPHFRAAQGNIKFHNAAITFDTGTNLADEVYGSTINSCKNITITPPKGEAEMVSLIGQSLQTIGAGIVATGTFQNSVFDQKTYSAAKMSCTLVLTGDETNVPDFLRIVSGTGAAIESTTYRRHTWGDSTTNQNRVTTGAILLTCENGSEQVDFVLNNPIVNWGDVKLTGTDGHFEVDVEATCLPQDFAADVQI